MPLIDCETPCTTSAITSSGCNDMGGIIHAFWTKRSDIATATLTEGEVTAYTMEGDGVFSEIEFNPEGSSYAANYTQEQGYYLTTTTLVLTGKSKAQRDAIKAALRCCDLVLHIYDRNCQQRVFGFETVDADDVPNRLRFQPMRIGTHDDTSGTFGGDMAQDVFTLVCKSLNPPLWASVPLDDLPTVVPTP